MKTSELIRTLSEDRQSGESVMARLVWLLPLALVVSGVLFALVMGVRRDIAAPPVMLAVLTKLAVTLPLAGAAAACAWRLAQPGRPLGRVAWLFALPVGVLIAALAADLSRQGLDGFALRLFGRNYGHCLIAIPSFSLAPLAAVLYALRSGAPLDPARTGLMAGLAAAGLGAALYALHCPDDSPLFILAWYSLAALITALAGRLVGRRLLAW